jgi:hypothetical protein
LVKLVRISDEAFEKIQTAQGVRESYGQVIDRAIDALLFLEREKEKKENKWNDII